MPKISVVIITYNEERNIARCIESVQDVADEIVVIDSFSTDRTEEICRQFAVKFFRHPFEGHIEQKNWAISQASYPHILSLDADEALSSVLKESILEVKNNWRYDGYYFNRLTNYCGKWIRHGSWYPSRKLRLWDSMLGSWRGVNPHDRYELSRGANVRFLEGDLLHYSYYSIEEHVAQTNRFSDIVAQAYFRSGRNVNLVRLLVHPPWRFFRDYIIKMGMFDGFYGLNIAIISAHETYLKYVKLREIYRKHEAEPLDAVCFFNSTQTWGGGEKWHFDISSRLSVSGYKTLVITGRNSILNNLLRRSSQPVLEMNVTNLSFLNIPKMFRLARILRNGKVRSIIINLSADLKLAGPAARIAGVPQIIYRRGSAIPVRNTLLNRYLYRKVITHVIANSEETRRTILLNNPRLLPGEHIKVIYNGLDLAEYDRAPAGVVYQRNDNEVILGNAGRLSYEKGQVFLLETAQILKEKNLPFRILIAGSGRLEKRLRRFARKIGVDDRVEFLGFIKNIRAFNRSIDIFVLTSLWEGFGYVMVEAMAEKIPVVAYDIGSSREIISEDETGFLVPVKDVNEMAQKVEMLINDPSLRKKMGEAGRKRVEEVFGIDRSIQAVKSLLTTPAEENAF